jgi:hydrogenase nickel incorporation protein HypB
MFHESAVLLINKIDLMPYVNFDLEKARRDSLAANQDLAVIEVSCKTGEGLQEWFDWIGTRIEDFKKSHP